MPDSPKNGPCLPDPEEAGISITERVTRIIMAQNAALHPEYTNRELRMLADLADLIGWAHDVIPILERHGVHYTLMRDHLARMGDEHGPWAAT